METQINEIQIIWREKILKCFLLLSAIFIENGKNDKGAGDLNFPGMYSQYNRKG